MKMRLQDLVVHARQPASQVSLVVAGQREDIVRIASGFRNECRRVLDYATSKTDRDVNTVRHGFLLLSRMDAVEALHQDIRQLSHAVYEGDSAALGGAFLSMERIVDTIQVSLRRLMARGFSFENTSRALGRWGTTRAARRARTDPRGSQTKMRLADLIVSIRSQGPVRRRPLPTHELQVAYCSLTDQVTPDRVVDHRLFQQVLTASKVADRRGILRLEKMDFFIAAADVLGVEVVVLDRPRPFSHAGAT